MDSLFLIISASFALRFCHKKGCGNFYLGHRHLKNPKFKTKVGSSLAWHLKNGPFQMKWVRSWIVCMSLCAYHYMICVLFKKIPGQCFPRSYSFITNIACKYFPPPSIYFMVEIRKQLHFTCNNGLTMRQNDICFHGRKCKRAPKAQKASWLTYLTKLTINLFLGVMQSLLIPVTLFNDGSQLINGSNVCVFKLVQRKHAVPD